MGEMIEDKHAVKPAEEAKQGSQLTSQQQPDEYTQLYDRLKAEKDKQDRQLERRKKRAELFSAIGDGISSLSNLFFTSEGAPNSYDSANSITEATGKRYDAIRSWNDAEYRDLLAQRISALKQKRAERRAEAAARTAQENADREYQLKRDNLDYLNRKQDDAVRSKAAERSMKKGVNDSVIKKNDAQANYYNRGGGGKNGAGNSGYRTRTITKAYNSDGRVVEQVETRSNDIPKGKGWKPEGRFNERKKSNTEGKGEF